MQTISTECKYKIEFKDYCVSEIHGLFFTLAVLKGTMFSRKNKVKDYFQVLYWVTLTYSCFTQTLTWYNGLRAGPSVTIEIHYHLRICIFWCVSKKMNTNLKKKRMIRVGITWKLRRPYLLVDKFTFKPWYLI